MRDRSELDACAGRLRERVEQGAEISPEEEAKALLSSGFSPVETGLVLAGGLGISLADIQLLFVTIAAEDRRQRGARPDAT